MGYPVAVPGTLPVLQVDAFAARPFGGNPAGVVLDAGGLTAEQMQAMARELGRAGTGFVRPTRRPGADLGLRYFTPAREVTYSGHTTLATVHGLLEAGRVAGPRVVFDTAAGLLPVSVERADDGVLIWLEPPLPACAPFDGALEPLLAAAGLPPAHRGGWARAILTPERDLVVPVAGLAGLRALEPDLARVARLATDAAVRGLCLVSRETVEPASATHARFFAPHVGIPEDVVTGSVHSSIAVWLWEAGQLPGPGPLLTFTGEQGDGLGRPGRLAVELHLADGRPVRVRVGGRAATVLTGTMQVPEARTPCSASP